MFLTHLSLFSGIGGLDLAGELAGFETVGQCEWADFPHQVLDKHWPDVPKWRDIRTLTGEDFYERTGLKTVDIISGGFPCQPFSVAGKRRGKADDRYLWPEMLRVISELQPNWVIGENVAGIVSMGESAPFSNLESDTTGSTEEKMVLEEICQNIENLGYEVQPIIIPACSVKAPHQRYRTFIVAHTNRNGRDFTSQGQSGGKGSPFNSVVALGELRRVIVGESDSGAGQVAEFGVTEQSGEKRPMARNADSINDEKIRQLQGGERTESGGICADVADTDNAGNRASECDTDGNRAESGQKRAKQPQPRTCGCGDDVPNTDSEGLQGHRGKRQPLPKRASEWSTWDSSKAPDFGNWEFEPDVGRVANGVSNRVDRLKCLGNAVVPQQAYTVFKAVYDIESGEQDA
jgi:DNA (cytosine-5)-methyltransferase 1